MKVGYARVSTVDQDLQLQVAKLEKLGVDASRIYLDHGFSGKKMTRDGLQTALAAVRSGDEFVVPAMDRLARNTTGALEVIRALVADGVVFNLGGLIYDPNNPMSKLFLTILAAVAEAEGGWISLRTAEAMKRPDVRAKLLARPPKYNAKRDAAMLKSYETTDNSVVDIAEEYRTSRASVYRALERAREAREATTGRQTAENHGVHDTEGSVSRALR
jgi:DNA invertase Pin-like site-specific DNA recombinase